MKIGMIALGCEKNRIDAEIMLHTLEEAGMELCSRLEECDGIIVHTCTFIDPAKEESIEAILNAAEYKKSGTLKKLIVTGCMAERYQEEILRELPEVDACLGVKSIDRIQEALEGTVRTSFTPLTEPMPEGKRTLTSTPWSVYLKIAEGCSNHCSYCVIPSVRGEFQPRTVDHIVQEAKELAAGGAKEINLIAQDTTRHPELCRILREVCALPEVEWVRILYCRPEEITDQLLDTMAQQTKCVPYLDIPLQHASGRILKKMNRTGNDRTLSTQLNHIRQVLPGIALRTTFITGFPSETEEDFRILCEFVKQNRFENLGVFPYSREEGTKAAAMHRQIPENVKRERADTLMLLQQNLLETISAPRIGTTVKVLYEGEDENGSYGRAFFQAPDVDGKVYFIPKRWILPGTFVQVCLERYENYDYYGIERVES